MQIKLHVNFNNPFKQQESSNLSDQKHKLTYEKYKEL
jgi:hypothetical protein